MNASFSARRSSSFANWSADRRARRRPRLSLGSGASRGRVCFRERAIRIPGRSAPAGSGSAAAGSAGSSPMSNGCCSGSGATFDRLGVVAGKLPHRVVGVHVEPVGHLLLLSRLLERAFQRLRAEERLVQHDVHAAEERGLLTERGLGDVVGVRPERFGEVGEVAVALLPRPLASARRTRGSL
jgi:hypothetical protein